MFRLGVTGGIGSGKTTVTDYMQLKGVPVVDADDISRALTAPGGAALPAIRGAFGGGVFSEEGALDRQALALLVFGDEASRRKLNAILHPMVIGAVKERLDALEADGAHMAAASAPLLFESGMAHMFDRTLLIAAPPDKQIERVMARDALDAAQVRARIDAQMPLEQKRAIADDVIDNDADLPTLYARVDALLARYMCMERR